MNIPEAVEKHFRTAQSIVKELEEKFQEKIANREHLVLFQSWLRLETDLLLQKILSAEQNPEDQEDCIQEFMIYASEYDVKGFSVDFLCKKFILGLKQGPVENN